MQQQLRDFVERVHKLEVVSDFEEAMSSFLADIGFEQFVYVGGRLRPNPVDDATLFLVPPLCTMRCDVSWSDRYGEQGYFGDDPIVRSCMKSLTPIVWTDIYRVDLTEKRSAQIMREAQDFKLSHGISVPIHGGDGEFGILSANSTENEREFRSLTKSFLHEIHVAAVHYHSALLRSHPVPQTGPKEFKLTDREVEVLRWAAQGKSSWDISVILGITERTVKSHLEHAMRKLGVHTRTHLTAKAISLGLIKL